jgi:hypothetical protein
LRSACSRRRSRLGPTARWEIRGHDGAAATAISPSPGAGGCEQNWETWVRRSGAFRLVSADLPVSTACRRWQARNCNPARGLNARCCQLGAREGGLCGLLVTASTPRALPTLGSKRALRVTVTFLTMRLAVNPQTCNLKVHRGGSEWETRTSDSRPGVRVTARAAQLRGGWLIAVGHC